MRLISEFAAPDTLLLPAESRKYNEQYNAAFQAWLKDFQASLGRNTMSPDHPFVAVPKTTIDAGSAVIAGTAAATIASFNAMALPNTFATTSSSFVTALSYTGRGILQRLIAISQSAAGTSTAAGLTVRLTLDDTIVLTINPSAANRTQAAVGSLTRDESALSPDIIYGSMDDVPGLPFSSNILIEVASGTSGQGVLVGWRVLKKL